MATGAQHDRFVDVPDLVVSGAVTSDVQQAQTPDVVDARAPGDVSAPGTRHKAVPERLRYRLLRYPLGDDPPCQPGRALARWLLDG